MHKRKDEIRDIYQGNTPDFEQDFTPQVAKKLIQDRQRDLRRSQIVSTTFGAIAILLTVSLIALVIRDFLQERKIAQKLPPADEKAYIPRYSLPTDSAWVMEYQAASSKLDDSEKVEPGPKPLSTRWVKNAAYHIIMGQQSLAINAPEQALEHFQKVVEVFPDIQGIHRAMGMLYLQQEDYAAAAEHLSKALEEEETFDILNNLGAAYIGTKEYDKAEKALLRAYELQPESPICHKNLAVLYRKMKQDDKAVYHFEKYLDLQPGDIDTMQTYALYLTKLGRWDDAATFLTSLTQEVTDVAPIYFLLAQVQIQNGHPQKAIAALKRGIQLIDPDLALAWMSREEFDAVRDSGEFKHLVDELEIANVSLDRSSK